jgi:hypothetical protein
MDQEIEPICRVIALYESQELPFMELDQLLNGDTEGLHEQPAYLADLW